MRVVPKSMPSFTGSSPRKYIARAKETRPALARSLLLRVPGRSRLRFGLNLLAPRGHSRGDGADEDSILAAPRWRRRTRSGCEDNAPRAAPGRKPRGAQEIHHAA